jgi:hypothetical protein
MDIIDNAAMLYHYSFGFAGGTGGIDDIGEIPGMTSAFSQYFAGFYRHGTVDFAAFILKIFEKNGIDIDMVRP